MSEVSSNESNPLYLKQTAKRSRGRSTEIASGGEGDPMFSGHSDSEDQFRAANKNFGSMGKKNEPLVFSNSKYGVLANSGKVAVWKKITYAIGSMPYAMCNTVVGFYFSIFLLEVVIMDATYVLLIILTGRVWDAITDPVVGYLTSLTKTRFGRLRPWLACSMIPVGILYFLMWYVPPLDDQPDSIKYVYYQIIYLLFQASLTCVHVPYTALTMHMTNDSKERDSVTLYRMCFEVSGTILGVFVYTGYYLGLVNDSTDDCNNGERVPDSALRAVYRWHALTLSFFVVIFITVTFLGVREQKEETSVDKRIGFFKGLKATWGFKPYFYLLMLELFSWLSLQFIQGNLALFIKYSVGLESQYPYLIAILLVSSIIFMPMWQFVLLKFGKKTTFYVGMWTLLPLLITFLFVDRFPYFSYFLNFVGAMGVSCAYLLPWSMLPDVIDEATLKTKVRREELFYAFFVFGNKFGSGVTLGISTAIYKIAGYDQKECEQPWTVPLTLKLLVTIPPVFFILISFIFLNLYPITEATRKRTKQLLAERRRHALSGSDGDSAPNRSRGPTTMAGVSGTNRDTVAQSYAPAKASIFNDSRQTDF